MSSNINIMWILYKTRVPEDLQEAQENVDPQ